VIVVYAILAVAVAAPVLVLAVMLGPVVVGILLAIGTGLLVAVLANGAVALGKFVGSAVRPRGHSH
jgi:hypothetical protein